MGKYSKLRAHTQQVSRQIHVYYRLQEHHKMTGMLCSETEIQNKKLILKQVVRQ